MSKAQAARGALAALVDAYKRTFDPKTYYHYSINPSIKKFNPRAHESWSDEALEGESRGATYFSSDPKYIDEIYNLKMELDDVSEAGLWETVEDYEQYMDAYRRTFGKGKFAPTIYPVKIKTKDIFDYKNKEQVDDLVNSLRGKIDSEQLNNIQVNIGFHEMMELPIVNKSLKEKGYRGYKTWESQTVGLFHPDKGDVRSIHAKFDPEKSESGNILASVPAAALLTLGGAGALSNLADE